MITGLTTTERTVTTCVWRSSQHRNLVLFYRFVRWRFTKHKH